MIRIFLADNDRSHIDTSRHTKEQAETAVADGRTLLVGGPDDAVGGDEVKVRAGQVAWVEEVPA